jgi:hypothetical protein
MLRRSVSPSPPPPMVVVIPILLLPPLQDQGGPEAAEETEVRVPPPLAFGDARVGEENGV